MIGSQSASGDDGFHALGALCFSHSCVLPHRTHRAQRSAFLKSKNNEKMDAPSFKRLFLVIDTLNSGVQHSSMDGEKKRHDIISTDVSVV